MVWVRLPVYFYKRNETFYFSRAIPSDLLHRFTKRQIQLMVSSEEFRMENTFLGIFHSGTSGNSEA